MYHCHNNAITPFLFVAGRNGNARPPWAWNCSPKPATTQPSKGCTGLQPTDAGTPLKQPDLQPHPALLTSTTDKQPPPQPPPYRNPCLTGCTLLEWAWAFQVPARTWVRWQLAVPSARCLVTTPTKPHPTDLRRGPPAPIPPWTQVRRARGADDRRPRTKTRSTFEGGAEAVPIL